MGKKRKVGGQPGNKNTEKWTEKDALRLIRELLLWLQEDEERIYFDEFLMFEVENLTSWPTEITPNTVSYLSSRFESFYERMGKIKQLQECRLKTRGLNNQTNANITKFLLSANFGLREKTEVVQENNIKVSIDGKDIAGE